MAIAPVHLFGNVCEIDKIKKFAAQHDLKIVWDAAQALLKVSPFVHQIPYSPVLDNLVT